MKINKTFAGILAGVAISGLFSFTMLQNTWNVIQSDSKITFEMPNGKHSGTVSGLNATIDFDAAHPDLAAIKATVDVKNLKSDNEKLTAHLMSADFFDAENHPQITFTAEKVTKTTKKDGHYIATGKLAMRDSVKTVEIPFSFEQDGKKATMKGKLDIFAGDYGVGKKSEKGSDKVVITIEVPLTQE